MLAPVKAALTSVGLDRDRCVNVLGIDRLAGAQELTDVTPIHTDKVQGTCFRNTRRITRRLAKFAVIVEAKPGARGNIAADTVAKAPPDGYTLGFITGGHAVSAATYKSLNFKPVGSVTEEALRSLKVDILAVSAVKR